MKITRSIMKRLLRLFASQKWVKALQLLSAKRHKLKHKIQKEFSTNSSPSSSSKNKGSDRDQFTSISNLLPAAITCRAPTFVLKAIIDLNPNILMIPSMISSCKTNRSNKGSRFLVLPLQYACSIGASSETIKTLLHSINQEGYKESIPAPNSSLTKSATTTYDAIENRTALHYAIQRLTSHNEPRSCLVTLDTSFTHQIRRSSHLDEKETILTISHLLDTYPDAVLHLDEYNQTPIDMLEEAKYSEQNLSRSKQEQETICIVCNILRRKAVQVYKQRKDIWENQGFDCSFFQPTKYIGNMQIICQ